jgi:hypothetical protein
MEGVRRGRKLLQHQNFPAAGTSEKTLQAAGGEKAFNIAA